MQRIDYEKANPAVMKAMMGLEQTLSKATLEKSLIELVRLRASQINGCAYCVDLHTADAGKRGEDGRRLATLVVWRETPFFTARERAALEWTESLTLIADNHVPDAVWQAVEPHFTPAEMAELTLVVNTINAWNRIAIAFRRLPT